MTTVLFLGVIYQVVPAPVPNPGHRYHPDAEMRGALDLARSLWTEAQGKVETIVRTGGPLVFLDNTAPTLRYTVATLVVDEHDLLKLRYCNPENINWARAQMLRPV